MAAVIHGAGLQRVNGNAAVPVEAETHGCIQDGWLYVPALAGLVIGAAQVALLAHAVHPRSIAGVGHHIEAVATAHVLPVVIADAAVGPGIGRSVPAAIVLHATHYVVGKFVVHVDVVKLSHGQLLIKGPALAAVARDAHASVIAIEHKVRVLRVDPPGVVIGVNSRVGQQGLKVAAPVFAVGHGGVDIVNAVLVPWVHVDLLVVERAVGYFFGLAVDQRPGSTAIVALV